MNNLKKQTSNGVKKLLTVLLCVSIISPAFAFAENKSERNGENSNSHKSVQMIQKTLKKEINKEKKEFKKELKEANKPKKVNYFFCVTATGWNVLPVEGLKENNSASYLGEDCVKLPGNIAKRLQGIMGTPVATTTPPVATTTIDIIAPVISSIVTSSVASTTATVSWNTNELATGKLYYGTSTPLTAFVSTTTLSLAHTFNLTGLTASTTYQLMVESKDAASNTATTTASLTTTM